jgi:arginyl-tRNA--protein-N-Asp/Glu arginylyltransferase
MGWYRMHQTIFTCSHIGLDVSYRVHWLRYIIHEIRNHSSHKRIRNRNNDFRYAIEDVTSIRQDHVELHSRYRASINFDGAVGIEDCLFGAD